MGTQFKQQVCNLELLIERKLRQQKEQALKEAGYQLTTVIGRHGESGRDYWVFEKGRQIAILESSSSGCFVEYAELEPGHYCSTLLSKLDEHFGPRYSPHKWLRNDPETMVLLGFLGLCAASMVIPSMNGSIPLLGAVGATGAAVGCLYSHMYNHIQFHRKARQEKAFPLVHTYVIDTPYALQLALQPTAQPL